MTIFDWFPSLTTAALLGGAVWLCRNLIATRLKKAVEHEFNEKIEAVRSQFRASEERLKSRIRAKETDIAALRAGALARWRGWSAVRLV